MFLFFMSSFVLCTIIYDAIPSIVKNLDGNCMATYLNSLNHNLRWAFHVNIVVFILLLILFISYIRSVKKTG
ncbi:MAG: hypothetical protein ACD_80C00134G0004 [uncultured bacterium (gcode 4)]|uniref:Uncharacterized protein n=1 Tax=uncultured bacterium (gcode 4) TaxID=1234023 RepID=K1YI04_9BACT|nr:MAG: hypothetical protein ACD_80C00134G0004 [uncultured bacterium (gcode 4)]